MLVEHFVKKISEDNDMPAKRFLPAAMQVLADPELRMTGSPAGVKVAGTIGLPEVMIRDNKKPSVVSPSEDVVIIGRPRKSVMNLRLDQGTGQQQSTGRTKAKPTANGGWRGSGNSGLAAANLG